MTDDVIENVVKQNVVHREIGYLEGMSDAYREMSLKRSADLPPLEKGLDALLMKICPPF